MGWREYVVCEARSWIGTPYQHHARVKGVGVDCGGLLYEVYNPIFGPFPAYPTYAPDWAVHRRNEIYLDFVMPFAVEVNRPIVGGFSIFQIGANYSHAGIYTDRGTYIHSWGRTNDGDVRESRPNWFLHPGGAARRVKHFDMVELS